MAYSGFYPWCTIEFIPIFFLSYTPRIVVRPVASHFLKMGLAAIAGGIAQVKPVFEPETYEKETDV